LFCLVLAILVADGRPGAQERDPRRPPSVVSGAYRRPLGNDPATLDPARIRDVYSLAVVQQLFDGLVEFDHTLTVVPALAQFWKASRDGLTWTFTLRRGVRFHHGRVLPTGTAWTWRASVRAAASVSRNSHAPPAGFQSTPTRLICGTA